MAKSSETSTSRNVAPPVRPSSRGPKRIIFAVLSRLVYLPWTALIILAPLAAAWVASSIAAHAGGSIGAAAASGLLVFPVLPVAWELFSVWRRSRKVAPRKRILTLLDRLVLRTLAVSAVLLGALIASAPRRVFVALNSRGDWMLDGHHDARSEMARRSLFWVAARTAVLNRVTDDNPFSEGTHAHPKPHELPSPELSPTINPPPSDSSTPAVDPVVQPEAPRDPHAWPWPIEMHPAVTAITPEIETSPESVGHYLAAQEHDSWKLARAVHDFVSDRIEYDVPSYRAGTYPPQDAETTFRTHKSVCAGYAALFEAIGKAAGLEVATVVGRARGVVATGMGEGHAWSAVKLDGAWHLVDTTWDAGSVDADGFHKHFRTSYFLTPPEVFAAKHFPDDSKWQLLPVPRSPGEYMRSPLLDPEFFAQGLTLVTPDRAESDAHGVFAVVIDNPRHLSLMVDVSRDGAPRQTCEQTGDARVTARCTLEGGDLHEIMIFSAPRRYVTHWSVGSLQVHNR